MDTYATMAELAAFLTKRGIADTWTDPEKEAALYIGANDYIDLKYVFAGTVTDENQTLALPTDEVDVTQRVKDANCFAALFYLQGTLFNQQLDPLGGVKRVSTAEKLDVMESESETEYFNSAGQEYLREHQQIDALLKPYLHSAGGGFSLEYNL